jgi:cytochrome P450
MTAPAELRPYPFQPFTGDLPAEMLDMVVTQPVSRVRLPDGRPAWLVLGYQECRTVLADPRFSRHPWSEADAPDPGHARDLSMNGPAHHSVRRFAYRAFTPRRIALLRSRVQRLADTLVDAMIAGPKPADLVSALVAPFPALTVCELLGLPPGDWPQFHGWHLAISSLHAHDSDATAVALSDMRGYLAQQLTAKRAAPADDLLSEWAAGHGDQVLTDNEITELSAVVLLAGLEINTISSGLRALFANPGELAKLRAAPAKLRAAVEEIIRYTTHSSMFLVQYVTEELKLDGVAIRAGDAVMAIPGAANRDPRYFSQPNVFDIDRVLTVPHVGLGLGPHFCLGAALGRLELEVAIGTLLRRLPGLAPAVPLSELPWRNDRFNCGMAAFPVVW